MQSLTNAASNILGSLTGLSSLQKYNANTSAHSFFKEIVSAVKEQDYVACAKNLNNLCGEAGFAKIDTYNGNFQIQLNFDSDHLRSQFILQFSDQLTNFSLSDKFEGWQFKNENNLFTLQCMSNQSVALLGINPIQTDDTFAKGQENLKGIKQKLGFYETKGILNNLILCKDIFNLVLNECGMETLGRLTHVNKQLHHLSSQNFVWKKIAELNIPNIATDNPPAISYKEQVKTIMCLPRNAARLGAQLEEIVSRIREHFSFGFRNGEPVMYNISHALQLYAEAKKLDLTFDAKQGHGQGATGQPDTIRDTFEAALSTETHGSFAQIYQSLLEHRSPEYDNKYSNKNCYITKNDREALISVMEEISTLIKLILSTDEQKKESVI